MKLGLLAAGLVLVAGSAAGCGGGGGGDGEDSHHVSSVKEFCGALKDFRTTLAGADPTKDPKTYVKTVKSAAEQLDKVGTPEDIPSDAQAGFDLTVKTINDLPDTATPDDLAHLGDASDADKQKLQALDDYVAKTCPELSDQTGQ